MKKVLIALAVLLVAGAAVGFYLWNKPHENMERAKADMTLQAAQLFAEYNTDQAAADAKYLDKTVAVQGVVKEVNKDEGSVKILLETGSDFNVLCTLVTFKGKCTGFNLDVQLERCVEVKQ